MADVMCPKCSTQLEISLKESLKPYSITYKVSPEPGRMIDAGSLTKSIAALSSALKAAGKEFDHATSVVVSGASVDEDMSVSITLSAIPVSKDGGDEPEVA